jgi:ABC-type transporter lipoprotein component MlaA
MGHSPPGQALFRVVLKLCDYAGNYTNQASSRLISLDPYVAMREIYIQYRIKQIQE